MSVGGSKAGFRAGGKRPNGGLGSSAAKRTKRGSSNPAGSSRRSKNQDQPGHSDEEEDIPDVNENELMGGIFDDSGDESGNDDDAEEEEDSEEELEKTESAADKRRRLAKQYLEDLKTSLGAASGEAGDEDHPNYEFDAKDLDNEIIASRLKQDVAEQKGWIYKFYGDRLSEEPVKCKTTRVSNNALTSVYAHWPYLYTTSKDIELTKWDIRDSTKNPVKIKSVKGGMKYYDISPEHSQNHHCDEIYTCVVSPDGKYVVTGGKDGRIIVWSTNSLSCIRVMETKNKRGEVLSMTFRRNSDQLYVACADLKIRTYSINQLAQLETLYGHQDVVCDISALGLERCVSVGSRDRTAMLWKIAEETRLTFRGGDSIEKFDKINKRREEQGELKEKFYFEGSIDCVSMVDDSHFVTGSDNGNVSMWSLAKKKPIFTRRLAHGLQLPIKSASAEIDETKIDIPDPQPYWITSIYALPFSDIFITGSWDGKLKIWKISSDLRGYDLIKEINVKGIVTKIHAIEDEDKSELKIYATLSKEHRLGRWLKPLSGSRNALFTYVTKLN